MERVIADRLYELITLLEENNKMLSEINDRNKSIEELLKHNTRRYGK